MTVVATPHGANHSFYLIIRSESGNANADGHRLNTEADRAELNKLSAASISGMIAQSDNVKNKNTVHQHPRL
jgi:hypothetical protein